MSDQAARNVIVSCVVAVSAALVVGVVIKSRNDTAFVVQATEQTSVQTLMENDLRLIFFALGGRS